jgi:hypothetical protein
MHQFEGSCKELRDVLRDPRPVAGEPDAPTPEIPLHPAYQIPLSAAAWGKRMALLRAQLASLGVEPHNDQERA